MGSYENMYSGAEWEMQKGYGVNSDYNHGFVGYNSSASSIGFPTDPTTANQLMATSKKISTGARTIEISGVNILGVGGASKLVDTIPKQHFKEINRLKELTGVDLTFHGPMVEPTGFQGRQGWTETDREMAEREIWSAVSRGHQLDPDGNIVVTFHSSSGLMDPEEKVKGKDGKEYVSSIWTVDERTGQFAPITMEKKDYFKGKEATVVERKVKEEIDKRNNEAWFRTLQQVSYHTYNGEHIINNALNVGTKEISKEVAEVMSKGNLAEYYKMFLEGKENELKGILGEKGIGALNSIAHEITQGDLYLRDAYHSFRELFNQAYDSAIRNDDKPTESKLKKFQEEIAPKLEKLEKDPSAIQQLSEELVKGVNVLRAIDPPRIVRPVKDFAIDKASETFANVALKAYDEFGDTAPIISIENPPAGSSGIYRAEDLRALVEKSHQKFVKKAVSEFGMSESEAKKEADKLIGVTWDVGHINMIKKRGYDDVDLIQETKKIAPYIKHVHLSDNFGIEHTELPMGMGNVPIKGELKAIESELKKKYGDKVKQLKKIVETGDWFSRTGLQLQNTPAPESFAAFGSTIYSGAVGSTWTERRGMMGDYFGGRGLNPDVHHKTFGGGYSSELPLGLGETLPGQGGRSRFSGTPME